MAIRMANKSNLKRHPLDRILTLTSIFVVAVVIFLYLRVQGRLNDEILAKEASRSVVGTYDTIGVPTPLEFVAAGTKVSEIRFKVVQFPKHQLPKGVILSVDDLVDATTATSLPAHLPMFLENFSRASHPNPVVEKIPNGMRAMTIRVDATSAVEGWAGTGSLVDVLLIEREMSVVVAEKIRVLSSERSVEPLAGDGIPQIPSTVTLLVTQEQCLAINTASLRGRLAFALRSATDDSSWRERAFSGDLLLSRSDVASHDQIEGYVEIKDPSNPISFALAKGRWIRANVKPEGFLYSSKEIVDD